MTMTGFAHSALFTRDVPAPAPRWTGFPKFNFIGGHNDPTQIPAHELAETAAAALRRSGASLAMYNSDGPQGYRGLRDFVVSKVSGRAGITCSADDVLITSGSGQGLDLVYRLLLDPGDTVLVEEFSYGGAISKLKRLGVNIVGMPLDAEGIRMDALARLLEDDGVAALEEETIDEVDGLSGARGDQHVVDRAFDRRPLREFVDDELAQPAVTLWAVKIVKR